MEAALILSRFDPLYGPKIVLKAPKSLEEEIVNKIPSLMELPTKEVFIHIFGKFKTANLFFKLSSPFARGGYESLLISLVTESSKNLTLMLANELLTGFTTHITELEDAYKAFDHEPKEFKADGDKQREITQFFFSYFESIIPALKTIALAEQRYQALFRAARDAIFIMNRDTGIIIDVNKEAENLVEMSKNRIVGIKAFDLELFDEGLVDPKMIKHLINQPPPIISRVKASTGEQIYLEVSVNEIQLADQYFIQYFFHDISDIQSVEEKLKEQVKKVDTLNKIISIANQANSLHELLIKIRDSFIELYDLKACGIYLINKSRKVANIKTHKGFPSFFVLENSKLDIFEKPYNIVFSKGVALINDNFPEYVKSFFWGLNIGSTAIIPLFSKFEIIGSLNMIFNRTKSLSPEEMELIITVGLELGTAIERMQNKEKLAESEIRNNILFNHIPFSIFRFSDKGFLLDFKLDNKLEKTMKHVFSGKDIIGEHITKVLPEDIAQKAQENINSALEDKASNDMKFVIPINDNKIIFQLRIVPLGKSEVLAFLQNISRTWS
ncbi:MAG: GAF domain-containing protein [Promethearchaeota archaeon]